jgi:hypothetical protein
MRRWWIVWPLYTGLMGFALGGSFFFGMYGRNVAESDRAAQYEHSAKETSKSKKEESDEALAYYTLWLMSFTGVLAFATIGLGIATLFLYEAANRANDLNLQNFVSVHRPRMRLKHAWFVDQKAWRLDGPLEITLDMVNIGNTPARITWVNY